MKLLKDMNDHLVHHKNKFIALAVLCKVMIIGVFVVFGIQTIQNSYAQTVYTIDTIVTPLAGGTISPEGPVNITEGDDQTFTLTANPGYVMVEVLVDGINRLGVDSYSYSYTFEDVNNNHTIEAIFVEEYTIVITKSGEGTITPDITQKVKKGNSLSITSIPSEENGYGIGPIDIDGVVIDPTKSYTFTNVSEDHRFHVDFLKAPEATNIQVICGKDKTPPRLDITFDVAVHGGITPADKVTIDYSESTPPVLTPIENMLRTNLQDSTPDDTKYRMRVYADAIRNTRAGKILTTRNMSFPFTVACGGSSVQYMIEGKIIQGEGSTNPELPQTVDEGKDFTIEFKPNAGYTNEKIVVNKTNTIRGANTLNIKEIKSNYTIEIYFSPTNNTPPSGGGGGGGSSITMQPDRCPDGDYTKSAYDKECGEKPKTELPSTKCDDETYLRQNFTQCLGLAEMANKLYELNDTFIGQNNDVQDNNLLTTTLQRAATKIGQLTDSTKTYLQNLIKKSSNTHAAAETDNIQEILRQTAQALITLNDSMIR